MKHFFIVDRTNNRIWIAVSQMDTQQILRGKDIDQVVLEIQSYCKESYGTCDFHHAIASIRSRMFILCEVILPKEQIVSNSIMVYGCQEIELPNGESFVPGIVFEDFASYIYGLNLDV